MNLFKTFRAWRKQQDERKEKERQSTLFVIEVTAIAKQFELLNAFRQSGLLYFDYTRNNVTIAFDLARYYLFNENPEVWQGFLSMVERWASMQYSISVYNRGRVKHMADVEARAYRENPSLSDADKRALRIEAADEYHQNNFEKKLEIPLFQYYVLGSVSGKPLLVARRVKDPETLVTSFRTEPIPDELWR